MNLIHVIILAIVQGLAELLPVSSSAHVIVAEKLLGMNPEAPEMTLLLVMLHTGTMFAVIVYFWQRWRRTFFQSVAEFKKFAFVLILASVLTGIVGGGLIEGIEKVLFRGESHAWIEQLFGRLDLIAPALAAAGILILIAGLLKKGPEGSETSGATEITAKQAGIIGAVQGLCLPFRGFSRSGATISAGMLSGVPKARAEDFSFALAVVLTPAAIAREGWRLIQMQHLEHGASLASAALPSLVGALFAFLAGLLALKWLSRWLETGRWYIFGVYCLVAACAVEVLHHFGF
ncbi:MAG: undecaprenyl-diphosphate phosphatase [Candidatus Acidiferrum sp.]